MIGRIGLVCVLVFLPPGLGAGSAANPVPQGPSLTRDEIDRIDAIFAPTDRIDGPGCALGITRDGATVLERAYGRSNIEDGTPITTESIFEIGSMTKQFTAMAVTLLADDGRLSLDDDVRKFIPEMPVYERPITLRALLHHTSGLRELSQLFAFAGWRYPDDLVTRRDALDMLTRQRELNFTPGDRFSYSNSGYVLLAIVVERASGRTFRQFVEERVFRPLGMTRSQVHDDHTALVPGRTWAYARRGATWSLFMPVADYAGPDGVMTTTGDLLKWMRNADVHRVGGPTWWSESAAPGLLNSGAPTAYGLGLFLQNFGGLRMLGHSGSTAGYTSDGVWFPAHKLGIAVLCNSNTPNPTTLGRAIAGMLLGVQVQPPLPNAASPDVAAVPIPASELQAAAGAYKRPDSDVAWAFDVRDGQLIYAHSGASLKALGSGRFLNASSRAVLDFSTPVDGAPGLVIRRDDVVEDRLTKMTTPPLSVSDAAAYVGEYSSTELQVTYAVVVESGALVLRQPKAPDRALRPMWRDAFMGYNGVTLRFTRGPGAAVTGLRLSNALTRNVAFVRTSR